MGRQVDGARGDSQSDAEGREGAGLVDLYARRDRLNDHGDPRGCWGWARVALWLRSIDGSGDFDSFGGSGAGSFRSPALIGGFPYVDPTRIRAAVEPGLGNTGRRRSGRGERDRTSIGAEARCDSASSIDGSQGAGSFESGGS
jgi:hypothetical protein